MGSMRDAFKKANLISGKDVKRLEHEERVHRSEVGREGVEREKEQRKQEIEQSQQADREATRKAQERIEKERKEDLEIAACKALIADEARRPAAGASVRYFFELRDGRLPFVEVGEQDLRQLQAGALSIVRLAEGSAHVYGLILTAHARRIAAVLPERVVHAPRGVAR